VFFINTTAVESLNEKYFSAENSAPRESLIKYIRQVNGGLVNAN